MYISYDYDHAGRDVNLRSRLAVLYLCKERERGALFPLFKWMQANIGATCDGATRSRTEQQ